MSNESLIIIDWPKLFEKRFTRIDFHNLDEITVEKVGFGAFSLNYGMLTFQKVNGGEEFNVSQINRPNKVARIIESYRENILNQKNFTEESALKGLLSQMVQTHVKDNGQPDREIKTPLLEPKNEDEGDKKSFFQFKRKSKLKSELLEEIEFGDEGGLDIKL